MQHRTQHDDRETTEQQNEPRHITLAREALLAGMTRESLVTALLGRVRRDAGYLAYRKACNRRTSYDEQVQQDMRALALAAVLLEEGTSQPPR